ncbi:MAG: hypothetical protein H0T73_08290 [Ardenticatenales bacterium]|nr:hypothetical protein [Ardenticatenales bacterium]
MPVIHANHIDDWHIADTLGNTLGTVAAIFVTVGLIGRDRTYNHILIKLVTLSLVVVELVALPLLGEPLDLPDTVATLLAGGCCALGYYLLDQSWPAPPP